MYITKMIYRNYGPINEVSITPRFDTDGKPIPLIFIGQNGAGKTLLLSSIVDSFIEFKRKQYMTIPETEGNKYFKIVKKDYIQTDKDYCFIDIDFSDGTEISNYREIITTLDYSQFMSKYNEMRSLNISESRFTEVGLYKDCIPSASMKKSIDSNVLLYFPFSRYEQPAWLNRDKSLGFKMQDTSYGESSRNIIKNNVIEDTQNWILDLALDRELYEKVFIPLSKFLPQQPNIPTVQVFLGYNGKNTTTMNLINELLTVIYLRKYSDLESARLGVSQKIDRNISVIIKRKDRDEQVVAPTLKHMSSGEAMLLGLFCSILKEYDAINSTSINNLSDVSGIVVIDEIDLHLHIEYQKMILPILIDKFPKVQFIITTHSPLFLLGMEQTYSRGIQLINLPIGNEIAASEFSEFEQMYQIIAEKNTQFKQAYEVIAEEVKKMEKPLLVTEGKTDWQHLKSAIKRMNIESNLEELPIDILEYEHDMGDTTLFTMCEQYSKVPRPNKIIFMFDRDNPKYIQKVNNGNSFRYWGNNVYSFCIPVPSNRANYNNISIEFYYNDEDLKTSFEGKRLHFSNEIEIVVKKNPTTGETVTYSNVLDEPRNDEEYSKKIYDQDVNRVMNDQRQLVALSKSVFAQNIYTGVDGFRHLDIKEFRLIVAVIKAIIEDSPS